jgi:hypothetical protein
MTARLLIKDKQKIRPIFYKLPFLRVLTMYGNLPQYRLMRGDSYEK